MSSGRIAQHRNYNELMQRHERDVKLRRVVKAFIYFLVIVALLILFVIVRRWEQKKINERPASAMVTVHGDKAARPPAPFRGIGVGHVGGWKTN